MALHAHPFVVAVELGEILAHRQAQAAAVSAAAQHVEDETFFPVDVGVLNREARS